MSRRVVEDRELVRLIQRAVADEFINQRKARRKQDQKHKNKIASIHLRVRQSPKEGYASPSEFAKYVGVSAAHISRLVRDGVLVSIQLGTLTRIPWSELSSPQILRGVTDEE